MDHTTTSCGRKITCLYLLLMFVGTLTGQSVDWTSSSNSWTYSRLGFNRVDAPHRLKIGRDTTIDGLRASIMVQDSQEGFAVYDFDSFDEIIVRQEEDRFYQYIDSSFRLLYDFSLEVGDTILGYVPIAIRRQDNLEEKYITFVVDSIGSISAGSRDLKGQYWRKVNAPHDASGALSGGWRYELLGVLYGYLLPYGYFFCDGDCPFFLRCFSSGGDGGNARYYKSPDFDYDCDAIINSTHEPDIGHLFTASPNPVRSGEQVRVGVDESIGTADLQVVLYDATGRQLLPRLSRTFGRIDVVIPGGAPAGIYTLVMRAAEGRAVKRLVVLPGG